MFLRWLIRKKAPLPRIQNCSFAAFSFCEEPFAERIEEQDRDGGLGLQHGACPDVGSKWSFLTAHCFGVCFGFFLKPDAV